MTFDIEEDINLWSTPLLDVLSDEALEVSSRLSVPEEIESTPTIVWTLLIAKTGAGN